MSVFAVRRGSESNDRLMNRFKKQFQETRLAKYLRKSMRYNKGDTKRMTRMKALKREEYRDKNQKKKFYSNI